MSDVKNKMMSYIHCKVRVVLQDSRTLVGQFEAFDKHMNLILADCEEIRRLKCESSTQVDKDKVPKELKEQKRKLGFILVRGQNVVTIHAEGPRLSTPRSSEWNSSHGHRSSCSAAVRETSFIGSLEPAAGRVPRPTSLSTVGERSARTSHSASQRRSNMNALMSPPPYPPGVPPYISQSRRRVPMPPPMPTNYIFNNPPPKY